MTFEEAISELLPFVGLPVTVTVGLTDRSTVATFGGVLSSAPELDPESPSPIFLLSIDGGETVAYLDESRFQGAEAAENEIAFRFEACVIWIGAEPS